MTSQKPLYSIEEKDNQIYALDYSADGDFFATAGRDCKIRVYEEGTKTMAGVLSSGLTQKTTGHSNRVYSLKFKKDEFNVLVSGGWDNTVLIWDTRAGHSVRSIYGPHICGDGLDIFGNTILTASWRPSEALQMWDFGTGKLINNISFHRGGLSGAGASVAAAAAAAAPASPTASAVGPASSFALPQQQVPEMLYCCAFSADGTMIAAGGTGTNEGKLFDVKAEYAVSERVFMGDKGVYTAAFAPNGRKVAFGGGSDDVAVIDLK
jgi:WD40 repeat protein